MGHVRYVAGMIVETLEGTQFSTEKKTRYTRGILCLLAALLAAKIAWFSGVGHGSGIRAFVDFDAFHLAAQMVWRGEIEQAYYFAHMGPAEKAFAGTEVFLPWTYPPQFDVLIAPLAVLPCWSSLRPFYRGDACRVFGDAEADCRREL